MMDRRVGKRYAEALVDLAGEQEVLDRIEQDLATVAGLWQKNRDFRRVLQHVRLTIAEKVGFLQSIFADKLHPLTMKFLSLVVTKGREQYLPVMYEEYVVMANERRGQVDAEVESGRPLPDEEVQALRARLNRLTGREVRLHLATNPDLIAGIRVKIGDLVIDDSIEARLRKLQRKLTAGDVKSGVR